MVGEAIVTHRQVDMISFTGSSRAGTRVAELAAPGVTHACRKDTELGGKSANVILDDADLEHAVRTGVSNCFFNSGQTWSAWTRMLVPRERYDDAVEIARQAVKEGARLVTGGAEPPDDQPTGFFLRPTSYSTKCAARRHNQWLRPRCVLGPGSARLGPLRRGFRIALARRA